MNMHTRPETHTHARAVTRTFICRERRYEPDFELHSVRGNQADHNSEQYIDELCATVLANLDALRDEEGEQ